MSTKIKTIWSVGLLCVILLILATGRTNVRNFEQVNQSIEEIYKDRLVVTGLVFDLYSLLHQKEIAILSEDQSFFINTNVSINAEIEDLLVAFRDTLLTPYEEQTLNKFSEGYKALKSNEKNFNLTKKLNLSQLEAKTLSTQIKVLQDDLKTLSSIQLAEGKRKMRTSDRAMSSMYEFENLEKYAVITLGFLMLLIILLPGLKENHKEKLE